MSASAMYLSWSVVSRDCWAYSSVGCSVRFGVCVLRRWCRRCIGVGGYGSPLRRRWVLRR